LKFKRFTSILAAAALSMLPACQLWAQGLPLQVEQNQLDRVGGARPNRVDPQANLRISERQAVGLARDRFAGNVLRIGLVGEGSSQRYQIRMENEGKVFTVFVNATSGRVTRGS
jgi:uncharacterized membrane protein YkoI